MAKKKSKKVIKYRRPLNINVGMIIFALILVYISISVYTYLRKDKIQFYEVQEGSIVNSKTYTGIILREEEPKRADRAGYVNYYVREGKRASVGTRIYSIDETGSIAALLEDNADSGIQLSPENRSDLKKQLTSFSLSYRDENFSTVYDMKYSIDALVMEYANFSALDSLDSLAGQAGGGLQQVLADSAGVVSYIIDSCEDLDISQISAEIFDRSSYVRNITKAGDLIESGAPVYKMVTSDLWSIVFPMSEEDVKAYGEEKSLRLSFTGRGMNLRGDFSMVTGKDGKPYGKVDFDKFMVQFLGDRYIEFEIVSDQETGLKIPVSAVTKKDFYLVPEEYLTQGGDSSDKGFNKEMYSESGTSVVFVPVEIYNFQDGFYYIDMEKEGGLRAGDYVVKPNSTDRYQIGKIGSLEGVYNINKGYAVFKLIKIVSSNEEYYTVQKNMSYGLAVYDHIVLDASTVREGQLVYN